MLGCEVRYTEDGPPQVLAAERETLDLSGESPFASRSHSGVSKRWRLR
jgi:hypothetical protein